MNQGSGGPGLDDWRERLEDATSVDGNVVPEAQDEAELVSGMDRVRQVAAVVMRLSRARARHTHDTPTAWAAAISGADHPRSSPLITSSRLSAGRADRREMPAASTTASAGGLRATIDAPAGKPRVHQDGAAYPQPAHPFAELGGRTSIAQLDAESRTIVTEA